MCECHCILSTKEQIENTNFTSAVETEPPFCVVIRATRRSSHLPSKVLSYFKTPSIGPAPEIEPATSRSAVKRPTD